MPTAHHRTGPKRQGAHFHWLRVSTPLRLQIVAGCGILICAVSAYDVLINPFGHPIAESVVPFGLGSLLLVATILGGAEVQLQRSGESSRRSRFRRAAAVASIGFATVPPMLAITLGWFVATGARTSIHPTILAEVHSLRYGAGAESALRISSSAEEMLAPNRPPAAAAARIFLHLSNGGLVPRDIDNCLLQIKLSDYPHPIYVESTTYSPEAVDGEAALHMGAGDTHDIALVFAFPHGLPANGVEPIRILARARVLVGDDAGGWRWSSWQWLPVDYERWAQ